MEKWYIVYNGEQIGPMRADQLKAYGLNPQSQVWREGMGQWEPAYKIPELMVLCNEARPSCASGQSSYGRDNYTPHSDKNKIAAGVLAILLGWLGVHYFYLNKIAGGFICILLCLVTCGLWSVLTIVQGVVMITMSDREFERKFVDTTATFPLF